jgi:GR25 family glycosyltransferase involved in LPS biosynthesis
MMPIRAFCITLPELPERRHRAEEHFRERNAEVHFFDGIHAEKFGLKTVYNYEVDHPGTKFNIGFQCVGCWLSHYMLWSALNLLWEDAFLVFEDDVVFSPDWHVRLSAALGNAPPDFDMIYVGSCCCEGKPTEHIAGEVYRVKYPMCTHAYVVAKKALPVLLRTQRKLYAPIDISMVFHSHPEMQIYSILPTIFTQFETVLQP